MEILGRPDQVVLFVTLDKRGRPEAQGYEDRFLSATTQPFLYAGTLEFQRWEGEKPITVWGRMEEAVPEGVWGELRVGGWGADSVPITHGPARALHGSSVDRGRSGIS